MKYGQYKNIIEAARGITKSKAKTREGAWRALKTHIAATQPIWKKRKPYHSLMDEALSFHRRGYAWSGGPFTGTPGFPVDISARDAWKLLHWRNRADHGGENLMKGMKLKDRWQDITAKRPRDPWNRALAKTRQSLVRDGYGALQQDRAKGIYYRYGYRYGAEELIKRIWLQSDHAAPAGWHDSWRCVRDIEAGADEHGGWEQRADWDRKGRGEQITVDLYGIDAAEKLFVIQVRQSYRPHKNWYLQVRKSYFMIGWNENGNTFAHPIGSGVVHGAIKRDPSPESPVRAARAWIWGIDEKRLSGVLRNGDVALIPAKCPQKEVDIFGGGEYRVDDDVASDHHVIADQLRVNGAVYALNPRLYHRKGQHPAARGEGWYRVVVGRRADFHDFARPTVD